MITLYVSALFFGALIAVAYVTQRRIIKRMELPKSGRACPIPSPRDVKIDVASTQRLMARDAT